MMKFNINTPYLFFAKAKISLLSVGGFETSTAVISPPKILKEFSKNSIYYLLASLYPQVLVLQTFDPIGNFHFWLQFLKFNISNLRHNSYNIWLPGTILSPTSRSMLWISGWSTMKSRILPNMTLYCMVKVNDRGSQKNGCRSKLIKASVENATWGVNGWPLV